MQEQITGLQKDLQSFLSKWEVSADLKSKKSLADDRLIKIEERDEHIDLFLKADELALDERIRLELAVLTQLQVLAVPKSTVLHFVKPEAKTQARHVSLQMGAAENTQKSKPYSVQIKAKAIPGVRDIVVVASGKGGVGKSTLATNLAISLQKSGQKVGLLDADIYGPSSPTMLGLQGTLKILTGNRIDPLEAHDLKCVSFGFLSDAYHPVLWRGPLLGKVIKQFLYDVNWGELDTLVIDLPPGTGDVQLSLIETLPPHHAVIVTSPQDVALIDAHKALSMFENLGINVLGVVENMATYICPHCHHEDDIFGHGGVESFATERKQNILAKIALDKRICVAGDMGLPPALDEDSLIGKNYRNLAAIVAEKLRCS